MGNEPRPGAGQRIRIGLVPRQHPVTCIDRWVPPNILSLPQVVNLTAGTEAPPTVHALKSLVVNACVWNSSEIT